MPQQNDLREAELTLEAINAYKSIFGPGTGSPHGHTILEDLRVFSKVDATSYGTDAMEQARILGRMEMFNRIRLASSITAKEKEEAQTRIDTMKGNTDE